jgi:hypothetical protein
MAGDGNSKYRVIDGKRFVWVATETGSNHGGHWVEEGLAPARNIIAWTSDEIQKRQDRGGEGSLITYHHHHGLMTHGY